MQNFTPKALLSRRDRVPSPRGRGEGEAPPMHVKSLLGRRDRVPSPRSRGEGQGEGLLMRWR